MNIRKAAVLLAAACAVIALGREGRADHGGNAITWGPVVGIKAPGCDAFTPVRAADGHHYTSYGDCSGLNGNLPRKVSMGFGRIVGGPANPAVQDLPTPDLTDYGDRDAGMKPSSALVVGGRLYMWVRNYAPGGTQARLKYSDDFTRTSGSNWTWAPWTLTQFGYPVFVQGAPGSYHYIVAHDNNSAYKPADRFVLMRVPVGKLLERSAYRYFSGTAAAPAWTGSYTGRRPILTAPGRSYRSGVSYSKARGRYYWWRNNGDSGDTRSFEVWSAPNPWGSWRRVYYTANWDMNPGERGEFPVAWMGQEPISEQGTLHLLFSGYDRMMIRRATIAAGH